MDNSRKYNIWIIPNVDSDQKTPVKLNQGTKNFEYFIIPLIEFSIFDGWYLICLVRNNSQLTDQTLFNPNHPFTKPEEHHIVIDGCMSKWNFMTRYDSNNKRLEISLKIMKS